MAKGITYDSDYADTLIEDDDSNQLINLQDTVIVLLSSWKINLVNPAKH